MKKLPSLLAAAAVAAIPTLACAQSSVTLYGIVDVSVEHIKSGSNKANRVQSGGLTQSRWGLRGTEDLGNGMKALFNLEGRMNVDDGTQVGSLFNGRAVLGLSGHWGTVTLGREFNPIYDLKIRSNAFNVAPYSTTQVLMAAGASRTDNAIRYDSPIWGGLRAGLFYSMGTESTTQSKTGRHTGLAAQYQKGPIYAGLAWNRVDLPAAGVHATNEWMAGGSYALDALKLYLSYWTLRSDNTSAPDAAINLWTLGASYDVAANHRLLVSIGLLDASRPSAASGNDARQFTLGYEYSLSKRTTLYAQYAHVTNKNSANYQISRFANSGVGSADVSDPNAFQLGMRHSF
ncbi:Outer membrane porin protein 32 precursor [Pigmentiphaga humi]|uniref:Outer membrane porin protein 32 n=1 Tax=Pigmentiphaga humi TaxID=2478468 RepID=A0A3P4AYB4_9BURK|nr:porin [Pigmentiphaga humi]VCU68408.1 Outer membrane porin protein 32 precursor [Pigmentiphaga humi]